MPTDNSISVNAQSLINSAMRLIGVLPSGEVPELSEANDALSVMQQMLDAWNAERLTIFTTGSNDFALVGNKQVYTCGIGGDFNISRPPQIDGMSAILLTNPSNPVELPMTMWSVDDWQNQIPVKTVSGSFPLGCYDDGGFPLRTLSMWPIPIDATNKVRIYSWQPLSVPATLATTLSFPPGYAEAFRYNLAVRLSAEFAATLAPAVQAIAAESLARIKSANTTLLELRSDLMPANGSYNYRADLFGIP